MDPEFEPHGALDITEGRAQPKYEKLVMRGGRFYLEGTSRRARPSPSSSAPRTPAPSRPRASVVIR